MNKVFLTGTLREEVEVRYTPQGERIAMFPLWVDDGAFTIEVPYKVPGGTWNHPGKVGSKVMASGTLAKIGEKANRSLRLKANKILWMEE
jgi:hypothetical protein